MYICRWRYVLKVILGKALTDLGKEKEKKNGADCIGSIHLEYVIYYQEKGQWREQRLTQKFARGPELTKKHIEDFRKEVKEKRLFGNFAILLCGESNSRGRRFDSDPCLDFRARVAELVDATDLKSVEIFLVPVRVRPWAPLNNGFY